MDIEKLEKLNELKEKGIITEEEFNNQKKEIFSPTPPKSGISWKNIGVSFLITVVVVLVEVLLALGISPDVDSSDFTGTLQALNIVLAIIMTIVAIRLKPSSNQRKIPAWAVFLAIVFFGCFGFWATMYNVLQIQQANTGLKD